MTGVATLRASSTPACGPRRPRARSSRCYAQTPGGSFVGVTLSVLLAATVVVPHLRRSCCRLDRKRDGRGRPGRGHRATMEATEGQESRSGVLPAEARRAGAEAAGGARAEPPTRADPQHRVRLRRRHGVHRDGRVGAAQQDQEGRVRATSRVVNMAIANLTDDVDLVVTHQDLTDRARRRVAVGAARLGRQLHEQPAVRRDRRGAEDHQRSTARSSTRDRPAGRHLRRRSPAGSPLLTRSSA